MLKVKLGRPAVSHVLGCVALLGRRVNPSVVKVVITTLATYHRLYKHGGIKYLVIYLKACSSMLQQVIGGQRLHDLGPFGARVGRTHAGIPSLIPALHRARIRSGCTWTIRFWATLFGLYRVLEFPGRIKLSTISKEYGGDTLITYEFSQFVVNHFTGVLKKLYHQDGTVTDALWSEEGEGPLEFMKGLRAKPFLISKSGPSVRPYNVPEGAQSTSPASILASAFTWLHSPLYPILQNWCKMTGNHWVLNRIESWAKELWVWEDSLPLSSNGPSCPFKATNWLGKLGFKQEPAGKVRVFAMVDPWTQWLMDRLHKAIFGLLERIPQDGTFDQLRPIHRLLEWQKASSEKSGRLIPLYSFDLSAATDRLPIVLQKVLLSPFLTSWGAELWACLMVGREYACPKTYKHSDGFNQPLSATGFVQYATGQPMGALSSWAMLAFLHHALVQWAAFKAGSLTTSKLWYEGYAILGDDVVIAGKKVAREYLAIMKALDVGIGDHKSLVSRRGNALEFAKRTFFEGKDVSMVPFAEFVIGRLSLAGLMELVRKYSLTLGQMLSVLGYGYKAKASVSKRLIGLPKRLRNYLLTFYGPGGPGYDGLQGWLPMKSVTSLYKTSMSRVSGLVSRFIESEVKLMIEFLDSYQPLIEAAKRLGTVNRDREHYGTTPRGADRSPSHPGIDAATPSHIVDSLNETVYREAFLGVAIAARDLRTKLEEISISPRETEVVDTLRVPIEPPEGYWKVGDSWFRWPTLEEYNASLERSHVASAASHGGPTGMATDEDSLRAAYRAHLAQTVMPEWIAEYDTQEEFLTWVGAMQRSGRLDALPANPSPQPVFKPVSVVPEDAMGIPTSPPTLYRVVETKRKVTLPGLGWSDLENLWTQFREIESEFAGLPFPKNLYTRVIGGKPSTSESKQLRRWYRYSSTFRATVDPVVANGESTSKGT